MGKGKKGWFCRVKCCCVERGHVGWHGPVSSPPACGPEDRSNKGLRAPPPALPPSTWVYGMQHPSSREAQQQLPSSGFSLYSHRACKGSGGEEAMQNSEGGRMVSKKILKEETAPDARPHAGTAVHSTPVTGWHPSHSRLSCGVCWKGLPATSLSQARMRKRCGRRGSGGAWESHHFTHSSH